MIAILNPYRYIDWNSVKHYKSNLHCHTKLHKIDNNGNIIHYEAAGYEECNGEIYGSDGLYMPNIVIDKYKEYSFDILAITDHNPFYDYGVYQESFGNNTTYPWTLWGRDPDKMHMIAVEGKEFTDPYAFEHDISLFCDPGEMDQHIGGYDRIERLEKVSDKMGLLSLCHPKGNVTANELAVQKERYNISVLVEIFRRRSGGDARCFWDDVLKKTMPILPIWGISVDDMHSFEHLGTNYTMHLLSRFTLGAVRHSLIRGELYFCIDPLGNDIKRHDPIQAPIVDRIEVVDLKIEICCGNVDNISWISEGNKICTGSMIDLYKVDAGSYVRAELMGKHGELTCTQPFGIIHPSGCVRDH